MAIRAASKVLTIGDQRVSPETVRAVAAACGGEAAALAADDLDGVCAKLREAGVDARVVDSADEAASFDEQIRVLLDAIGEGVCLGDTRGRVLWSNAFFQSLDPATRRLVSERMREGAARLAGSPVAAGGPIPAWCLVPFEIDAEEGGRRYEVFVTPAPPRPMVGGDLGESVAQREANERRADREGRERVAAVVRDITRARQNMAKLRAIDQAGEELVRLDSSVIRNLNSFQRLQLLEDKIVRLVHEVLQHDHFAIFLIDERRNKLELVISAGLPQEIQELDLTPDQEGNGISGYVAATGKSYVCRDASTDDRFLPGLDGAKSSLTVPLRVHDRVIGIMDIESKQADAFDEASQQFVEIFSRYVALALHMLDLLVVERSTTNLTVSDRVLSELREPLDDIVVQLGRLEHCPGVERQSEAEDKVRRIREDVESIRARLSGVADGPQTLIGVDRAMTGCEIDPVLAGKRVLVADDQPKIRKVIGAVLRARGCEVEVCPNGESAIAALDRVRAGEAAMFDLIVSDIQMPDRNGYEVFAAAKRSMDDAKVILMTGFGYDPHHSIVRASQQGLCGVLFKPFDIELLIGEVRKALAPPA